MTSGFRFIAVAAILILPIGCQTAPITRAYIDQQANIGESDRTSPDQRSASPSTLTASPPASPAIQAQIGQAAAQAATVTSPPAQPAAMDDNAELDDTSWVERRMRSSDGRPAAPTRVSPNQALSRPSAKGNRPYRPLELLPGPDGTVPTMSPSMFNSDKPR